MAQTQAEVSYEFNSMEGLPVLEKAVKAAKTREDVIALFNQRPGNQGHKRIIALLQGKAAIKQSKA